MLLHARTAALVPVVTTAVREGDATATQSLRDSAEAIRSFTTVVASDVDTDCGAIKKSTSMLSTSSNLSNPRRTSSVPNEADVTPPLSDQSDCDRSASVFRAQNSPRYLIDLVSVYKSSQKHPSAQSTWKWATSSDIECMPSPASPPTTVPFILIN